MKKNMYFIFVLLVLFQIIISCSENADKGNEEVKYPSENIDILVPLGVGGIADVNTRLIAQYLESSTGEIAVVNNKPGAGGAIAATEYLTKPASMYNLLLGVAGLYTMVPLFNQDINYTLSDFKPVIEIQSDEFIIYVNKENSDISDFEELLDYGSKNKIVFASNPPGAATHLLQSALYKMAGIEAVSVPNSSNFEDIASLMGGHVIATMSPPNVGRAAVEEGLIVPIAVLSEEPYKGFEGIEVPTLKSFGYDIVYKSSNFLVANSGLSDEEIEIIYKTFLNIFEDPEFIKIAKKSNFVPSGKSPQEVLKNIEDSAALIKSLYDIVYK